MNTQEKQTLARYRDQALPWLAIVAILLATTLTLRSEGRRWWCACGQLFLWAGDVWSQHNSQHLFDPYSFTHILHGLVFCGILTVVASRLSPTWRLTIAVAMASCWEILENSAFVIQRYRSETISIGYQGDSVFNSLGDIFSCAIGFFIARKLGFRWATAVFVLTEVLLLIWVRDSLILNIIMLIHPIPAIKTWQTGH